VACTSASNCWAVGRAENYVTYITTTVIQHWDGASWTIVPAADTSDPNDSLFGVACSSSSDCWAIGLYFKGTLNPVETSGFWQTLTEHWDGNSWARVTSPNEDATNNFFGAGLTCVSASDCWAVGAYPVGSTTNLTLAEHYTAISSLIPTSVVSRKTHGTAGTFDVDLPLTGNPGIECRSGGTNGDYTLVFTFGNPLANVDSASVTSGTGSVTTSNIDNSDAHNYIVNLTGVTNAQTLTVNLTNVTDSLGNFNSAVQLRWVC
jgi:hypothetical protein